MTMLRVHSKDLHEHVVAEVAECLTSGVFTDLIIKCKDGEVVHAHSLVLCAVSPYLRHLIRSVTSDPSIEHVSVDLSDHSKSLIELLLNIVYAGSIDASVEQIKKVIVLAHSLGIPVPVSEQLTSVLGMDMSSLMMRQPQLNHMMGASGLGALNLGVGVNETNSNNANEQDRDSALTMLQQQILSQYALINSLVASSKGGDITSIKKDSQLCPAAAGGVPHPSLSKLSAAAGGVPHPTLSKLSAPVMQINDQDQINSQAKNHLNEIINSSYNKSSNVYHCTICNSTYNHPGNFKQHMLKHEREARGRIDRGSDANHLNAVLQSAFADRVDNGDPSKLYVCQECNRTFKHPGNYKQHMASHNRPVLTMSPQMMASTLNPIGGLKRPLPGLVKMANEPATKRPSIDKTGSGTPANAWQCPECKIKFDKDTELQQHMKNEHDIEMVIPPPLGVNLNNLKQENMDIKEDVDAGCEDGSVYDAVTGVTKALISCDVPGCYQSFTTTGWLARHKAKMHPNLLEDLGPSIFSCTQCGKDFNKMSKLTQHVKTHSPESHYRYPCDICGKKFTRPQHVNRHKLLHTGERPYACQTCDKAFTREDKLKHHLRAGCPGLHLLHGHGQHGVESIGMNDDDDENSLSGDDSSTRQSIEDTPNGGLQVGVIG